MYIAIPLAPSSDRVKYLQADGAMAGMPTHYPIRYEDKISLLQQQPRPRTLVLCIYGSGQACTVEPAVKVGCTYAEMRRMQIEPDSRMSLYSAAAKQAPCSIIPKAPPRHAAIVQQQDSGRCERCSSHELAQNPVADMTMQRNKPKHYQQVLVRQQLGDHACWKVVKQGGGGDDRKAKNRLLGLFAACWPNLDLSKQTTDAHAQQAEPSNVACNSRLSALQKKLHQWLHI